MQQHLLLVDDEIEILELLQESLQLRGYRVSIAASADAARKVVYHDPPNLIVSDLQMEDTDGLVLMEEFRKALPEVPVLLLTGVVFDPEVIAETINKKVTSYLDKTTPLEAIVKEIQRLLTNAAAK